MSGREGSAARRLFLLGVGLALLAGVAVVAYAWLDTSVAVPGSPALPAWITGGGQTARQAYDVAGEAAAAWQGDARLAAVSGQRVSLGERQGEETQWSLLFYSPSTQRLAIIAVENGAARVMRESLSPYRMVTFAVEDWRVDSDEAQGVWWQRGGNSMVAQRPDIDLLMQLRISGERGEHPVWTVTGVVAGTDSAFSVLIDAVDGSVIES